MSGDIFSSMPTRPGMHRHHIPPKMVYELHGPDGNSFEQTKGQSPAMYLDADFHRKLPSSNMTAETRKELTQITQEHGVRGATVWSIRELEVESREYAKDKGMSRQEYKEFRAELRQSAREAIAAHRELERQQDIKGLDKERAEKQVAFEKAQVSRTTDAKEAEAVKAKAYEQAKAEKPASLSASDRYDQRVRSERSASSAAEQKATEQQRAHVERSSNPYRKEAAPSAWQNHDAAREHSQGSAASRYDRSIGKADSTHSQMSSHQQVTNQAAEQQQSQSNNSQQQSQSYNQEQERSR
jgi:hypothetical protein